MTAALADLIRATLRRHAMLAGGERVLIGAGDSRVGTLTLINTMIDYSEPGVLGSFTDDRTVARLEKKMTKEGTLVRTAGLRPTKEGFRVRSRHGKLSTTDGSFTESKEVIGGYAVLEATSKEHAIELTKRVLAVHGDEWDLECEVRPLDGPEFGGGA